MGDRSPCAILKIGARKSPLAIAQAQEVRRRLLDIHPDAVIEITDMQTTGDRLQDRSLAEIGGKGLFTRELDEALAGGQIDLAVHSMKDMETRLPPGQVIAAVLPREDPRDVLVCPSAATLSDLPAGAVFGTASLRRAAQALHLRPDLKIAPLRGNVATRLQKLHAGQVDGTMLALAGLRRLGLQDPIFHVLDTAAMLPAVAQGAIAIVMREGDQDKPLGRWLAATDDAPTRLCVTAERAMLRILDGSCRTPIAGLAVCAPDGRLTLQGLLATPDGRRLHRTERTGTVVDAIRLGEDAGRELRLLMGHARPA